MNRRKTSLYGGMGCICAGYWFIHRQGSLRCWHNPNAPIDESVNCAIPSTY